VQSHIIYEVVARDDVLTVRQISKY